MNIKTKYLGMELKSPLVVAASPVSEKIENIKKMEDAGAGAIVLYSLFQEQVAAEQIALHQSISSIEHLSAEAMSYFPEPHDYRVGPDGYLEHIKNAKAIVNIPIIASLNGSTPGGWTEYAKKMQEAGADAIELNLYKIPTDINISGEKIEQEYLDIVKSVCSSVSLPVAVKLSPYFSNMANMALRFKEAGANALVLFNRFYQPDIDLETLEVDPKVSLSHSGISRLAMTWIAILKGRIDVDFAATSGIHTGLDAIKMFMVGANVTMIASALLKNGIEHIRTIEKEMVEWMTEKEYESVEQMTGSMSQSKTPDPGAFERAQYMKALTNYKY
ncbi:dihydroorotate dehydrogenase-like protein [Bacteroidota bacterium]